LLEVEEELEEGIWPKIEALAVGVCPKGVLLGAGVGVWPKEMGPDAG